MTQARTKSYAGVRASHYRADLQGLRAIAVLAVLVFHLDPRWLPGGYVGVDIFFVLSGYLITDLLVRELNRTGGIQFLQFYTRRFLRLLPAATVVLLFCLCFIWVLPPPEWKSTIQEIVASALYLENWALAWKSVDYLAAEAAASPVQHYWSLAVEEQFYIVWPALIVVAGIAARRMRLESRTALLVAMGAVFALSLGTSIYFVFDPSPRAYFITPTRMWELAAGGILAVIGIERRAPQPFIRMLR